MRLKAHGERGRGLGERESKEIYEDKRNELKKKTKLDAKKERKEGHKYKAERRISKGLWGLIAERSAKRREQEM